MPHSVLVVDDQPDVARLLSLHLAADDRLSLAGVAQDGVEAGAYLQRECPDAIVCDVWMPQMGGLEALPLLRKACPGAVIVMFTSDTDTAKSATELGPMPWSTSQKTRGALIERLVRLCTAARQDPQ